MAGPGKQGLEAGRQNNRLPRRHRQGGRSAQGAPLSSQNPRIRRRDMDVCYARDKPQRHARCSPPVARCPLCARRRREVLTVVSGILTRSPGLLSPEPRVSGSPAGLVGVTLGTSWSAGPPARCFHRRRMTRRPRPTRREPLPGRPLLSRSLTSVEGPPVALRSGSGRDALGPVVSARSLCAGL